MLACVNCFVFVVVKALCGTYFRELFKIFAVKGLSRTTFRELFRIFAVNALGGTALGVLGGSWGGPRGDFEIYGKRCISLENHWNQVAQGGPAEARGAL